MIRLIIFDFSQTLAYRSQIDWDQFFLKLNGFSIRIATPQAQQKFQAAMPEIFGASQSWEDLTNRLVIKAGATVEREERERLQDFLERKLGYKLFDDVLEVINLPQKKAILTSSSKFLVDSLSTLRDFEIFSPNDGANKPELEAFLAVLKKMQADPEETVMVGNSIENDILPAKAIGIKAVLIDRENTAGKKYEGEKIASLKELKRYL